MRPRISIRGCVRPSVGPSVRPSVRMYVCHAFVKNAWNWEFYVQKWSWRHTKSWITSKQLSSISTTKGGYCRTHISSSHLSHLFGGRYARELLRYYSWLCMPSGSFLYIKTLNFMYFLQKRDIHTYRRTDRPTDGRTHPLIEMRGRI